MNRSWFYPLVNIQIATKSPFSFVSSTLQFASETISSHHIFISSYTSISPFITLIIVHHHRGLTTHSIAMGLCSSKISLYSNWQQLVRYAASDWHGQPLFGSQCGVELPLSCRARWQSASSGESHLPVCQQGHQSRGRNHHFLRRCELINEIITYYISINYIVFSFILPFIYFTLTLSLRITLTAACSRNMDSFWKPIRSIASNGLLKLIIKSIILWLHPLS